MSRSNESLAMLLLLDATAEAAREEGQRARDQRVEQVRLEAQRAAGRRQGSDYLAMILAVGAAVTVLVPWLIGHFLLTKTSVLKADPSVYVPDIRGISDHFLATYLGGLVPVALGLGVFLVARRPWQHRIASVVIGWIAVAASLIILLPAAMGQWKHAEANSAAKLRETAFPFSAKFLNCASWTIGGENGVHQTELWQVHLGQVQGTPGRDCNRVFVYRGWQFVVQHDLPEGNFFTRDITVNYIGWPKPYEDSGGGDIFSEFTTSGVREPMNPNATSIDLLTTSGQRLVFTLAGEGPFDLR